jgi:predicted kinase
VTEIRVLRGLPASGKTTHAKSIADTHSRVSRDDIRASLTGRTEKFVGDYPFEQKVSRVQEDLVRAYIKAGRSVVIDDTNLRAKYARRWIDLANTLGVESDVMNFKVPLPELLERNAKRLDRVPDDVIRGMYVRFPYKDWKPVLLPVMKEHTASQYERNTNLPPCVTVDLDGTLALHSSGRNPYDTSRYHEDTLNEPLAEVLAYLHPHVKIGVFTGRSEEFREVCEQWLDDNGVEYDFLLMRARGDQRQDGLIKKEIFTEHIAPKYKHLGHWDDRNRVVESLRSIGVQVWQVADGDF